MDETASKAVGDLITILASATLALNTSRFPSVSFPFCGLGEFRVSFTEMVPLFDSDTLLCIDMTVLRSKGATRRLVTEVFVSSCYGAAGAY